MGIGPYLSTLAQALLGNIQQQPQTPAAPQQQGQTSQMPTQPQQQGGLTGFLSSPLTQGALGAYFGAIGAPRRSGLGGMLSRGGMSGLSTFDQAIQEQERQQAAAQQAALLPYKIQQLQAQTGQAQAGAGLTQAKAQQIAGIGDANAALAAQLQAISNSGSLNAEQKNRADVLATAIANDKTKVYDPNTAIQAIYSEPLKDQLLGAQVQSTQAGTKQKQAETAAIPSEVALRGAEAARATAETGAIGAEDWYDPATKQQYHGTQRKPTDVLVSSLAKPSSAAAKTDMWYDPDAKQYYRGEQKKPSDVPASTLARPTSDKGIAEWYDPETKQYYKGDQKKPTDIPASKVSTATAKQPDRLLNLNRMRTLYDKTYGVLSTFSKPPVEQFSVEHGVDPISGEHLPVLPSGGRYVWDADGGRVLVVDASGKPTHQFVPDE